ncbi:MAG: peroxidase-related enzyme [Pontibacterium sp.]
MKSQPDHITALDLAIPEHNQLPEQFRKYFSICEEKLGMVPNVLKAYSQSATQLDAFSRLYNDLMFADSGLSELEREMIAVAVSSSNRCYYCQVAHGAAVRDYSGEPKLGELMVMNYRIAELSERHRAMLDFAVKLTETPDRILEADRQALRDAGFSDRDIWDIANVAGFYNMTNRVASAVDMQPNPEYHSQSR